MEKAPKHRTIAKDP